MRKLSLILLGLLFFAGCNKKDELTVNTPSNEEPLQNKIIVQFQLLDSNNVAKTAFNKDEKLYMNLLIRNELAENLHYSYTGTPVGFDIMKGDSLIAGDWIYRPYEMIEINKVLKSREEISWTWYTAYSIGKSGFTERIKLQPGLYTAKVCKELSQKLFLEQKINIEPILFEIIE